MTQIFYVLFRRHANTDTHQKLPPMSIFKKIFSPYADGKNENSDKAAPEENGKSEMQKKSSAKAHIDLEEQILEAVVEAVKPLRGMKGGGSLRIHTCDPYFSTVISDDEFPSNLALAFDNEGMEEFGRMKVAVSTAMPQNKSEMIEAIEGKLFIAIGKKEGPKTMRISILAEALKDSPILLDSAAKHLFHIGRGKHPINTMRRENDIAVAEQYNTVSSAHADIKYKNGRFFLQAKPGGCRAEGGSATFILRDGQPKELLDTFSMTLLRHNDIIELGKTVRLKVEFT